MPQHAMVDHCGDRTLDFALWLLHLHHERHWARAAGSRLEVPGDRCLVPVSELLSPSKAWEKVHTATSFQTEA